MSDDFLESDSEDLERLECPSCGKVFDVGGNKWESGDVSCPFCGAEIDR